MERFDLNIWTHILLSCESDQDYVNGLVLVPHRRYREYLLNDKQARQKRVARYTIRSVSCQGEERWTYKGRMHREGDLPAFEAPFFLKIWYKHGVRHRDGDKPAVIYSDGDSQWYQNGVLHRDGGKPARIRRFSREWWREGVMHRGGGLPAYENDETGCRQFWLWGRMVREDLDLYKKK